MTDDDSSNVKVFGSGRRYERQGPISPGPDVTRRRPNEPACPHHTLYMEGVGSLLYIANVCRPDLSLAVSILVKAMADPAERHWALLKGVLRYLAGTRSYGIIYGGGEGFVGYTDADYACCPDTRRSRSGYVFLAAGGAGSWKSHGQPVAAPSHGVFGFGWGGGARGPARPVGARGGGSGRGGGGGRGAGERAAVAGEELAGEAACRDAN